MPSTGEAEAGMATSKAEPAPIVVLACSAGGLESLKEVLGSLPGDFPATVIIVHHRSPYVQSPLVSLLGRWSKLPVREAARGEALRPGEVLVIPLGFHALVTAANRIALVRSDGPPPYRPSADLLLVSLALVAPLRSVAVILSGTGRDGATGATALHDFGGRVIAADEASSAYFAMPRAVISCAGVVDLVCPVEKIADELVAIVG